MNICKKCGAEIDPAIGNCSVCDASAMEQTEPTVKIPKPVVAKPAPTEKPKKKKK